MGGAGEGFLREGMEGLTFSGTGEWTMCGGREAACWP